MPNNLEPRVEQWYAHLDKGQRFFVTAVDEDGATIEVQHFDGDIEEFTLEEWRDLDIETSEAPESWSGALDIAEADDFGTEITDTEADDWNEAEQDFRSHGEEKLTPDSAPPEDEIRQGLTGYLTPERVAVLGEPLVKRTDGRYEQKLSDDWMAEYSEKPETGLWQVEVFKHDTLEWRTSGYVSLEEARQSAEEYYKQL